MRNVLRNLKQWWKNQRTRSSSRSCLLRNGGKTDLYLITALFFAVLFLFNLTNQIIESKSITERAHFTLPFLLLAILYNTKYKNSIDFFVDSAICMIMTIQAGIGDFSGISFLYLILFRIDKKSQLYIVLTFCFISIGFGSIVNNRTIPETFVILSLNIFMGIKYYYDIYLVVKKLRKTIIDQSATISDLKRKLSILGTPKGLTNEEILNLYDFMVFSEDEPSRKIDDVILIRDGKKYQEIADINEIESGKTIYEEIIKIRAGVSKRLGRDISNNAALIFGCVELGILQPNYTYTENI